MTHVTQPEGSGTADPGQSTTGQAKEKVQETAQQVQEQVDQKAQEVRGQAGQRVREQLDTRSVQAGEQVTATAGALRRAGEQLREEGQQTPARLANEVADRAERLGSYLREADADRMLRDVENFARRQPWVAGFVGVAAGFLASRFVKASSSRRYAAYEGNGYATYPPAQSRQPALPTTAGAGDPAMAAFGAEEFVAEPLVPSAGSIGGGTSGGQQNR